MLFINIYLHPFLKAAYFYYPVYLTNIAQQFKFCVRFPCKAKIDKAVRANVFTWLDYGLTRSLIIPYSACFYFSSN